MLRLNQCTGALDWQIAVSHVVYYVVPAACSLELLLDSYQPTKLLRRWESRNGNPSSHQGQTLELDGKTYIKVKHPYYTPED